MSRPPLDVPRLAHSYRRLILWFGAQLILVFVVLLFSASSRPGAGVEVLLLAVRIGGLVILVALALYAYRTAAALGSSVAFVWAIAMFIPLVNLVALLALSANATRACRASGIPVGFFGPRLPTTPPATTIDPS